MTNPGKSPSAPTFRLAEFKRELDRLEVWAFALGGLNERERIFLIMNSADADGRLPLAWQLAASGMSVEAALEALRVQKLATAFTPIDSGAALRH